MLSGASLPKTRIYISDIARLQRVITIDIITCNGIGNAARACIRIRIKSCEHSVLRW